MKNRKIASIVMLFIFIVLVFSAFSMSQVNAPASNAMSRDVASIIQKFTASHFIINPKDVFWRETLNDILRKMAHVFEYLLMGLFLNLLISFWTDRLSISAPVSLLVCFVLACADEWSQLLTPGRGPAFRDVLIDSIGVLSGIVVSSMIYALIRYISNLKTKIVLLEQKISLTPDF